MKAARVDAGARGGPAASVIGGRLPSARLVGTPGIAPACEIDDGGEEMKSPTGVLYVAVMVVVVVVVDVLFFRGRFWERLLANVGIVVVFAAFYLLVLRSRSG
jgi:hypothetical protein